jgi:WD40 repeat protein
MLLICQIYANETPLGELSFSEFVELVVEWGVQPERPDDEDAPYLSDGIWELATTVTVQPRSVPSFSQLTFQTNPPGPLVPPPNLTLLGHTGAVTVQQASAPSLNLTAQANLPLPNLILHHTNYVYCAAFSPDGKCIVSGSADCTILIWDAQTGNHVLRHLKRHTDAVFCVAYSPDGRQIASGSWGNTIIVWDAVTGMVVAGPFKGHTGTVESVSFSLDGNKIVSGSQDNTVWIWDAQTGGNVVGPLKGHTDVVTSAVVSADGKQIASGSVDMTIRVWDAKSGRPVLGPLNGHKDGVHFVAFSPSGRRIVSVSFDGDACVWDVRTGALFFGPSKQHAKGTLTVAFTPKSMWSAVSPDGQWIAEPTDDRRAVNIWNSVTGHLTVTLSRTYWLCVVCLILTR